MKTVLFVCVQNAARSQMASAFFNHIAEGRHRGISAGSQPARQINPDAVKGMAELGIDLSGEKPKKLTSHMIEKADKVIIMGCGEEVCPIVPKEIEDWGIEDPKGQSFERIREIRDQIKKKVEELIASLD